MFDITQVLTPLMIFVSYGLTAVLVSGAWWAGGRAGLEPGERWATVARVALVLLAWQTSMVWLAQEGAFLSTPDRVGPQIALAIFLPIPIALALIAADPRLRRIVAAVPLPALVGVQFYRVLGAIFLVLWWDGRLPGAFALPAGLGDVIVGLTAVAVATALARGARDGRRLAWAWNVFGAADLVVAVSTGFLTSPGALQMLALEEPNRLVAAFPLALVPLYAVPVSFVLHALVWQRLRAERDRWNAAIAT